MDSTCVTWVGWGKSGIVSAVDEVEVVLVVVVVGGGGLEVEVEVRGGARERTDASMRACRLVPLPEMRTVRRVGRGGDGREEEEGWEGGEEAMLG